jgi:N-acetylated-alpha-linked acidic dipeptidase
MFRPLPLLAFAASAALAVSYPMSAQQRIRGFPADLLPGQVEREGQVRSVPNADTLSAQLRILSADPHEAGTDRSRRVAELILARFKSYGLDARIEQFEALLPRPVSRTLELVSPAHYTAVLEEPPFAGDEDTSDPNQLPTFNAYAADGDVTAPLVFVNYGIPEDYRVLDSLGISVAGKIVIARYGRSWRGIKPKLAAERGAVGCLIYSDPKDDGYFVGDVYPAGTMRPEQGVQRGSIMDMPIHPGDPLSPGWASEPGGRRLPISSAKTLMTIPVLPISYGDALPLMQNLTGPLAPEAWRGALPITYHIGPGPATVHLALEFEWQSRPLYDVIGRIPGERTPDQWIVYGNHHDAWVNGAADPLSGQVALGETARALGALLKTGWRPARTIVFAAWDGEEWGIIGSTEWAEKHQDELREKAVAYFNTDSNSRGWLNAGGSHSLQTFMAGVARDIRDPMREKSALEAWVDRRRASQPAATADAPPERRFTIGALGSGSDYAAFLDFVGLAVLSIGYGGELRAGVGHSIYDTYDFYRRFSDTTFAYGVMLAQTMGTAILRLADAPVLPFEFTTVVHTYRTYVDEIEQAAQANYMTEALDLSEVRAALDRLQQAADHYETTLVSLDGISARDVRRRWNDLAAVNKTLYQTERMLTEPGGLEGREWYRHLIYAPGFFTGYSVKTMPGIREAVEDRPNAAVAQREAGRVAAAIDRYAVQLNSAADALQQALR